MHGLHQKNTTICRTTVTIRSRRQATECFLHPSSSALLLTAPSSVIDLRLPQPPHCQGHSQMLGQTPPIHPENSKEPP